MKNKFYVSESDGFRAQNQEHFKYDQDDFPGQLHAAFITNATTLEDALACLAEIENYIRKDFK